MNNPYYSPAMNAAVAKLNRLIADGWEFPDACWKVAKSTGFSVDELRRAYDDQPRNFKK